MRKLTVLFFLLIFVLAIAGCDAQTVTAEYSFYATVLEVDGGRLLVRPSDNSQEQNSSDRFEISLRDVSSPVPSIGDTIRIVYNGEIQEVYPARITKVYRIEMIESNAPLSAVYWNLDRKQYTEADVSSRTADSDGFYAVRFVSEGKLIEAKTADKSVVEQIDTMDAMGLLLDADGVITDVFKVEDIAIEKVKDFCIKKINGNTLSLNYSVAVSSMDLVLEIPDDAYVMDVRPDSAAPGQGIDLELLDRVNVYCDQDGVVTAVFLHERVDAIPVS